MSSERVGEYTIERMDDGSIEVRDTTYKYIDIPPDQVEAFVRAIMRAYGGGLMLTRITIAKGLPLPFDLNDEA